MDNVGYKRNRCRALISAFVDYLQSRFPKARITIRNDPNETIALTYARMIMANQSMSGNYYLWCLSCGSLLRNWLCLCAQL